MSILGIPRMNLNGFRILKDNILIDINVVNMIK